jgi:hypothetical protein
MMAERSDRRQLAATLVVACALLVGRSLLLPATSVAAPAAQEQPGKDLDLELGADITETLEAWDSSEIWQRFVFRLSLPAGAELTVWLGEDAQGGCYTDARLYESGNQVGYTRVGPQPSSWSEPIVATIASGKAQLSVGAYDDCDASVVFPTEKHFRFQVGWGYETIQLPPRILYLRANGQEGSTTANAGARVTLSWEWEGVEAGYLDPGNIGMACPAMPCTYDVTPAASTTYTLRATNSAGSVERSVTVNVRAPPVIEFWAEQDQILVDACTTLHWHIENIQAAYLSGGGFDSLGVAGPRGSQRVCPAVDTNYDLRVVIYQAAEQLIDETRQVTIRVEQPPTPTPTRTPTRTPSRTPTSAPTATRRPTRASTTTPSATPRAAITRVPTRTPAPTGTPTPADAATPSPAPKYLVAPTEPPRPSAHKLLVVTHSSALNDAVGYADSVGDTWDHVRSWLDQRYGADGYDLLDLADTYPTVLTDQWQVDLKIAEQYSRSTHWAIFIIGGHDVVPQAIATNPTADIDSDILWTDDLYADMNGDWIPDVPLARLPDGADFSLLRTQLTGPPEAAAPNPGFVMVGRGLTYAEEFAAAVGTSVVYSPPFDRLRGSAGGVDSTFAYFDLVGAMVGNPPLFNRVWYGCESHLGPCGTVAFTAEDARSRGVVLTAASYAGLTGCLQPGCPHIGGTIPIRFLANGARAYMGTTASNYRIPAPVMGEACTGWWRWKTCSDVQVGDDYYSQTTPGISSFARGFISYWSSSSDPLVAYYLAKVDALHHAYQMAWHEHGRQELKMMHGLVYYGVPDPRSFVACPGCASIPVCPSGDGSDCDGDGLPDQLEHDIVNTFKPRLVFDRRETEAAIEALQVYWQVSPADLAGSNVAVLTMIMTWPYDYGPGRREGVSLWDKLWCSLGDTVADFEYMAQHCGDTEGIRFFVQYRDGTSWEGVADSLPARDWHLTHIDWKRHSEGFDDPGDPIAVRKLEEQEGLKRDGRHPIVYVSGRKHAMYPDPLQCEYYTESQALCRIWFELCEPGVSVLPDTPYDHNVGERPREDAGESSPHVYRLLDDLPEFPYERAWSEDRFCGGFAEEWQCVKVHPAPWVGKTIPTCSGGMGNMWFP